MWTSVNKFGVIKIESVNWIDVNFSVEESREKMINERMKTARRWFNAWWKEVFMCGGGPKEVEHRKIHRLCLLGVDRLEFPCGMHGNGKLTDISDKLSEITMSTTNQMKYSLNHVFYCRCAASINHINSNATDTFSVSIQNR